MTMHEDGMKPIYLDYNATTPIDRDVVEAMAPYLHDLFDGRLRSAHRYSISIDRPRIF